MRQKNWNIIRNAFLKYIGFLFETILPTFQIPKIWPWLTTKSSDYLYLKQVQGNSSEKYLGLRVDEESGRIL